MNSANFFLAGALAMCARWGQMIAFSFAFGTPADEAHYPRWSGFVYLLGFWILLAQHDIKKRLDEKDSGHA